MITSLIFDFDGLILDTETPEFMLWQKIYAEHDQTLPAETWGQVVGGAGAAHFDPAAHLQELLNRPLDIQAIRARHREESLAQIHLQNPREGVEDYLFAAQKLNLKLAIASSSSHNWVDAHLKRLEFFDLFDAVICRDDVEPGRTKPHPDLFIAALNALQVKPSNAVIFEDSPNGVLAATRAEVFAVAVPNPFTAQLKFPATGLTLPSMKAKRLEEVIQLANARD